MTGLDAFDGALQTANAWLKEIMEDQGWQDRHKAYLALRAVLHELRDILTVSEACQLSAQMPLLFKGVYFDGWKPKSKPPRRSREEFLERVRAYFRDEPDLDAESVVHSVWGVLLKHLSREQLEEVRRVLAKGARGVFAEKSEREEAREKVGALF